MNFTIFRNFSGIFLNLFDFYFDFLIFNLIKKYKKMWVLLPVHTWHRHVDRRERLCSAEVTRGADVTWIAYFIYIIYITYIPYKSSDYRKTRLLNPHIRCILYTENFSLFSPSGTIISGRVAAYRMLDLIAINAMTLMRWTRDPPHQQSSTCAIKRSK